MRTYSHPLNSAAADHTLAAYEYDALVHEPSNAAVARSYARFREQTVQQWNDIIVSGLTVDFHDGDHNYASSADMFANLAAGHLYTYATDAADAQLPTDHPMLPVVTMHNGRALMLNDVFRAVHDVNGHLRSGGSFALSGEYAAWKEHRTLYSAEALAALWCETRSQSAWTNRFGDHASLPLKDRPFAAQKAGMPPVDLI
jgi:hypothetical protein